MQTTSALYKQIVASSGHWFETKIAIDGHELAESQIISLKRELPGMTQAKPSVGGALSATLALTILAPAFTIPRMAEIDVYFRARNSTSTSEWLPAGVFFIDTRKHDKTASGVSLLRITAYDAMMKAEQDYPDTNHNWPYTDRLVVAEIAAAIGVTVDSRSGTFLTCGYPVDMPVEASMRGVLENIAAMYGGNFVITKANKLLFVPLYGLDDANVSGLYLACEDTEGNGGKAVIFGDEGWFILV